MRKATYLVIVSIFILVAGCSSKEKNIPVEHSNLLNIIMAVTKIHSDETLVFSGESESWEITYVINMNVKGEKQTVKVIRYKGKYDKSLYFTEGNEPPISYIIYKPSGKTGGKTALAQDGIAFNVSGGCCSKNINKNTTFRAVVAWKNNEEELELNYIEYPSFDF